LSLQAPEVREGTRVLASFASSIASLDAHSVCNPAQCNQTQKGKNRMQYIEIKFKATLQLDEKWASNHTTEELIEYIKERINSSLGFRGQIKKLSVLSK